MNFGNGYRIDGGRRAGRARRITVSRLLVAAALALVGLASFAATAAAEHRTFRFGIAEGVLDPRSDLARMGDANVKVLRTSFSWNRIERQRGTGPGCNAEYRWDDYDEIMRQATRRDIRVLPVIIGSPDYVPGPAPSNAPPTRSGAIDDYRCFVRALVSRYGRGTSVPGVRPITAWQVWNEPNLPNYAARRKIRAAEYARLLKLTSFNIRGVDPAAKIIVAGMPELARHGTPARQFLRKLYSVKKIKSKFDALAFHPYAEDHRGIKGAMIRLRRLLRQVKDAKRHVWVTETGFSSDGPKGHFLVSSESGQARRLEDTFRMLRSNRQRYKIGTVNWLRWRDLAARGASNKPFEYAGLFRRNGSVKPSCRKFVRFTNGSCRTIPAGTAATTASSPAGGTLLEKGPVPVPSPPE